MQSDYLKEFSDWVESFEFEDIPSDVIHRAKLQIANTLAGGFGSLHTEDRALTKNMRKHAEEGNCIVLDGLKTDISTVFSLNSIYSMMNDFDDILFMGHTGHSSVFSSLAACQVAEKDGAELVKNVVLGNELGGRLGASAIIGPHNGQLWSFIHQANAAVITSSILGGDKENILNALAMSLYNPPYPLEPGFMGGESKYLTSSLPGVAGIKAGLFSLSGAQGFPGILEHEKGFLKNFSFLFLPEMLTGFGKSWVSKSLSFKPYPGCEYDQSPLECVDKISLQPEEVQKIKVKSSLLTLGMENMSKPYRSPKKLPPANVNFSVPYSIATMLTHNNQLKTTHLTRESIQNNLKKINKTAEKISLKHDWKYTIEILKGVNQAVDFKPLLRKKGLPEIISALRKLGGEHSGISGLRELVRILTSGRISDIFQLIDSGKSWDTFDLGKASFNDLSFNFGSSIEVVTKSGGVQSEECIDRRGICQKGIKENEELVKQKLETEANNYFGDETTGEALFSVIKDLENREISELTSLLESKK